MNSPRTPKNQVAVGVWGAYQWNNFGDDLMAVMTALAIRNLGYRPVVYNLNASLVDEFSIDSADSIDSICQTCSALVIGGGGFLCASHLMDGEWIRLESALNKSPLPIHVLSIGGNGLGEEVHCSPSCQRVLRSPLLKSATLRLEADRKSFINLIGDSKCKVLVYPDVVLQWPLYQDLLFDSTQSISSANQRPTLILNLSKKYVSNAAGVFFAVLAALLGINLLFARTHLLDSSLEQRRPNRVLYEFTPSFLPRSVLSYNSLKRFLFEISRANLILSSKLHLGCAGLAAGSLFISLNGQAKTKAFLRELGLSPLALNARKVRGYLVVALAILSCRFPKLSVVRSKVDFSGLEACSLKAKGHIDRLNDFLNGIGEAKASQE